MWWTEDKIKYYERAARYTSFHRLLADEIEKRVDKNDRILEFGAGLGYVTEILIRDGYNVKAIEKEENAIRTAHKRAGFDFMEEGDAYGEIPEADVILMIFFGRLAENDNLSHFLPKAGKKIINISGRHKGYSLSRKQDHTGDLPALLDEMKIPYEHVEIEAEFNQPFESIVDARNWFQLTYGRDDVRDIEKFDDKDYPFIFRNRKRTVMTVIDTKGERK